MRAILLAAVLAVVSFSADSQLAGDAGTDTASHGWVVVQVPGETSATLAYLPPRGPTQLASPSPEGRMRAIASLTEVPTDLAADGASVYMLFAPEPSGQRRVGMLGVRAAGVRDLWVREPESRLAFLESVPPVEEVLGLASEEGRLVVLVRKEGGIALFERSGRSWDTQDVPALDASSADVTLHTSQAGLHILEAGADGWRMHTRHGEGWELSEVRVPSEGPPLSVVGVWRGEVIAIGQRGERCSVWSLGEAEPLLLGTTEPPGTPYASAVLHSSGRLVISWSMPGEETAATGSALPRIESEVTNPVRRLIEFSLIDGRTVYAGPANATAPVSPGEFRALALGLILLMAVVLVVVLRPAPETGEIALPMGLAISGPGRRLAASALDGMVGLIIVARALDMGVLEVLGPIALPATGIMDIGPLAIAVLVNIAHCSVSEAIFGRSLGKAMTGLIVARVDSASATLPPGQFKPPAFGRSVLRNTIKWVLPPVAMLALTDPNGRHRGDVIARSAVLCRAAEPFSDE